MIIKIYGSFEKGCSITIWNNKTDEMYQLIVFEDEKGCYVEIKDQRFYKDDIIKGNKI